LAQAKKQTALALYHMTYQRVWTRTWMLFQEFRAYHVSDYIRLV